LAIPPYFHSSCVSLATASAVSGASIGMFGIPFLLQYLLDTYGLRGATLLGSCLWLSVGLAGALFGKGVTSIQEEVNTEILVDASVVARREHPNATRRRSNASSGGLLYRRRTSILPMSVHYHQQQHRRLSSLSQQHYNNDKLMINMSTIDERFTSDHRDRSRRYVEMMNTTNLIILE
jgi:hypothetical protein